MNTGYQEILNYSITIIPFCSKDESDYFAETIDILDPAIFTVPYRSFVREICAFFEVLLLDLIMKQRTYYHYIACLPTTIILSNFLSFYKQTHFSDILYDTLYRIFMDAYNCEGFGQSTAITYRSIADPCMPCSPFSFQ